MKKATKKTQCQQLLAYIKKNRKGITTMEAFEHLRITCLHKRIAELERTSDYNINSKSWSFPTITRTRETTATGSTVTRYRLAR